MLAATYGNRSSSVAYGAPGPFRRICEDNDFRVVIVGETATVVPVQLPAKSAAAEANASQGATTGSLDDD